MSTLQKRVSVALVAFAAILVIVAFTVWGKPPADWPVQLRFWVALIAIAVPLYAASFPFEDDRA